MSSFADKSEAMPHEIALETWHNALRGRSLPRLTDISDESIFPFRDQSCLVDVRLPNPSILYVGPAVYDKLAGGEESKPRSLIKALLKPSIMHLLPRMRETPKVMETKDYLFLPFADKGSHLGFLFMVAKGSRGERFLLTFQKTKEMAAKLETSTAAHTKPLYQVLEQVYILYHMAQQTPEPYKRLLEEKALKVQVRAPFTPLLKLVFGNTLDKTRIAEYAATLSYALRQGISPDAFFRFLDSFPGGIKGAVQEERLFRKQERGKNLYAFPSKGGAIILEGDEMPEGLSIHLLKKDAETGHTERIETWNETDPAFRRLLRIMNRSRKTE